MVLRGFPTYHNSCVMLGRLLIHKALVIDTWFFFLNNNIFFYWTSYYLSNICFLCGDNLFLIVIDSHFIFNQCSTLILSPTFQEKNLLRNCVFELSAWMMYIHGLKKEKKIKNILLVLSLLSKWSKKQFYSFL